MVNLIGLLGDHTAQAACGNDLDILAAHLCNNLTDQIFHIAHVTAHYAGLNLFYGITTQYCGGHLQLYPGQHSGSGNQSVQAYLETGTDGAAQVDAVRTDCVRW